MPLVIDVTERIELVIPPLLNRTLDGEKEAVKPEGETDDERVIVPVKLEMLVKVIEAVPDVAA